MRSDPRIAEWEKIFGKRPKAPAFNKIAARKPGGYLLSFNLNDPASSRLEMDTFTCVHCNSVVVMHPQRQRPRNMCRKCNRTTCDQAACRLECDHWEKKLDQGRPWLQPHQVPAEKIDEWFPQAVRGKTPAVWLPRKAGGSL